MEQVSPGGWAGLTNFRTGEGGVPRGIRRKKKKKQKKKKTRSFSELGDPWGILERERTAGKIKLAMISVGIDQQKISRSKKKKKGRKVALTGRNRRTTERNLLARAELQPTWSQGQKGKIQSTVLPSKGDTLGR